MWWKTAQTVNTVTNRGFHYVVVDCVLENGMKTVQQLITDLHGNLSRHRMGLTTKRTGVYVLPTVH